MINLLFCGNYKVVDGILLCLMSIIKHTKSPLNVFILTADVQEINPTYKPIEKYDAQFLENVIKKTNNNSKINLISLDKTFNSWINSSKNRLSSYTPFAFLRLFADKIENFPNKIIYLDSDIMVNSNIDELNNIDISNYELAVVKDRYGRFFINPKYFNSGMLIMNMVKIKETGLLEKVRNLCFKKRLFFPDQTALNKCCKIKLFLPRKFNEQGSLKANTIIHHFSKKIKWFPLFHTVNIKPWQIEDVQNIYNCHAYDDIYKDYQLLKNELTNQH